LVKFAVIAGSASKDLGKRIARRLKAPYVEAKTRVFPDGESKITFGRIPKNSVVLVVQSTYPPVDTNLLQALSIISQARKAASKIYAIIPYMGYARQDKQFLSGEVVTMSIVAKMLKAAGAKKIIILMKQTDKKGIAKILPKCTFPLTTRNCVNMIITEKAVFNVSENGLELIEMASGLTMAEIEKTTGDTFSVANDFKEFKTCSMWIWNSA